MDKSEKDEIQNLIDFGDEPEKPSETPFAADPEPEENIEETKKIVLNADDGGKKPRSEDTEQAGALNPDTAEDARNGLSDSMEETQVIKPLKDAGEEPDAESGIDSANEPDEADGAEESGVRLTGKDIEYEYDGVYSEDDETEKRPLPKALKIIKWGVIAAAVITAIVMFIITDTGFIGAYKRNFNRNFHKLFNIPEKPAITQTNTSADETAADPDPGSESEGNQADSAADNTSSEGIIEESVYTDAQNDEQRSEFVNMEIKSSVIIPYELASESDYGVWKDGVICASTNYLCYINDKGETEWECTTSVIDPILDTAGNYILIAQEGGTKLCLYEGGKLIYDTDCEDTILAADLSESGDCVLVTNKDLYKGAIAAYNKSGNLIFAHASGSGSIIDASISPTSRNIAAALLDTEDTVRSTVEIFDITKDEPIASAEFDDIILFDTEYFGNTVNVFGDNGMIGIKPDGETAYDRRFENADLSHYAYDTDGNKLLMLNASNIPTLAVYNLKGREKSLLTVPEEADYLCVDKNSIMYNNDREIISGKADGKIFERYTASMDIRDLIMVDRNTFFIVYSNSLELIKK